MRDCITASLKRWKLPERSAGGRPRARPSCPSYACTSVQVNLLSVQTQDVEVRRSKKAGCLRAQHSRHPPT